MNKVIYVNYYHGYISDMIEKIGIYRGIVCEYDEYTVIEEILYSNGDNVEYSLEYSTTDTPPQYGIDCGNNHELFLSLAIQISNPHCDRGKSIINSIGELKLCVYDNFIDHIKCNDEYVRLASVDEIINYYKSFQNG